VIGASISDLHLGFRAFTAMVGGRNAREVDVERAWFDVVDTIRDSNSSPYAIRPSLVTIAGDIFHNPRPSMHAVKAFRDGLHTLTSSGVIVVVVQGNHDAGRTVEALSPILIPDDLPGVFIITEPQIVPVVSDEMKCAVHCFPFTTLQDAAKTYKLSPTGEWGIDILLVHAAVKGDAEGDKLPHFYGGLGALDIGQEADRFDVVAVGDFHEFRRLHPDKIAFYSGSIERTSNNIWQETKPKGVVYWNTDDTDMDFVPTLTRPMYDYQILSPDKMVADSAEDINAYLADLLEQETEEPYPPFREPIYRLTAPDFPRDERDSIDWKLVRELKKACLHFELNIQWAKRESEQVQSGDAADRKRTLADDAAEFFANDPAPVRDLCLEYLESSEA